MKRIFLSGLIAGFAFFIWLSLVHLATPLAQVGLSTLPDETAMTTVIRATITTPGLYFFPAATPGEHPTRAERRAAQTAAMEKMKTSPTGILVVFPNGKTPLSPRQLITELLNDLVQGLLLAWLLAKSSTVTLGEKMRFALVVGLTASILTNVSYWNWYGFPGDYTMAYMFGEVSGYLVMGFAVAVMTVGRVSEA